MQQFHFTREYTFTNKMVMHLNMLSSGVKDRILHLVDVAMVVAVDHNRIGYCHL